MLWSAVKCCAPAHESLNAASMFRDCACPRIELWTTGWCADGAPMCRFSRGLWMLLMDILVFRFPLLALPNLAPLNATLHPRDARRASSRRAGKLHRIPQSGRRRGAIDSDGGVRRAARGTCAVMDGAPGVGCGLQRGKDRLCWLGKRGLSVLLL